MQNVWKIAPGKNADVWKECLVKECISIDWLQDVDLLSIHDKEKLLRQLEQAGQGKRGSVHSIWNFVHNVQIGDIVIANKGQSVIEGIGIIASDYLEPHHKRNPNRGHDEHTQVRKVDGGLRINCDLIGCNLLKPRYNA